MGGGVLEGQGLRIKVKKEYTVSTGFIQIVKLETSNSSQIGQPRHALALISVLHTLPFSVSTLSVLRMTWRNS